MKKFVVCLLAILMLLSIPVAQAEPAADTLNVGTTTAMSGNFMNGMFGSNTADIDVRNLLHGYSLTHWDADEGAYLIDWTVVDSMNRKQVEGGVSYTLKLAGDLKYSDGSAITAWDYAFSMLLALSPQGQELGASISGADHILGSQAYRTGEAEALAGVRVLADDTLCITVREEFDPDFYYLGLLDFNPYPISQIASGCEVKDTENGCMIQGDFTTEALRASLLDPETGYVSHPAVVSGPYTLVSYDAAASTAVFQKNPNYKGNFRGEKVKIEKITYQLVDNAEAVTLLSEGKLDLLNKATKADTIDGALELTRQGKLSKTDYPRSGLSFVNFSCELPAVASAEVRQAIAQCFDKATFIEDYLGSYGVAVDGYYGVGQWMVEEVKDQLDQLTKYAFDVEAASALLEENEWKVGADGIRSKTVDGETVSLALTILYPQGNEVGTFLTKSFAPALEKAGIELTVVEAPFAELLQQYYRQTERSAEMIYLASNFGTVYDPSDMFDPADAYQGVDNRSAIDDAELFQLATDLRKTEPGDESGYCSKWVAMQKRWTEVLPAIPVYSNTYYDFYTTALRDYDISAEQTWAEAVVGAYLVR